MTDDEVREAGELLYSSQGSEVSVGEVQGSDAVKAAGQLVNGLNGSEVDSQSTWVGVVESLHYVRQLCRKYRSTLRTSLHQVVTIRRHRFKLLHHNNV